MWFDLVPDAQEVLTRASEFFRDKDNTVFHKEYPINFRQRGHVPTIQISIAKDGTRAEYEVFKRFSELVRCRMAVIISHRFSTVRIADRIIVLSESPKEI
jgi:hypothetical protein